MPNIEKGKDYTKLKKSIQVVITNFKVNESHRYKEEYMLLRTTDPSDILTDKLRIIFIDLEKFRKTKKDLKNKEHLYLSFIDKYTNHEQRKELGKMDEGLKASVKKIEEALQDENALRLYYKLEWEEISKQIEKKKEREKGVEEGIEKGKENTKIEIATQMKNDGIPVKTIAKYTNLSKEFIERL